MRCNAEEEPPWVIPLLNAPYGTAFVRCMDGSFQKEPLVIPPDV